MMHLRLGVQQILRILGVQSFLCPPIGAAGAVARIHEGRDDMSVPGSCKGPGRRPRGPKPFRHLVLLLDFREPGHVLIDLKPATVQPLAWKLLLYLAESAGSVIPYGDLYEVLWGDTVVEMNQLSYQKNAVLSAIAEVAPERRDIILTFPKVGFMLDLSPREVLIVPSQVIRYASPSLRGPP